MVMPTLPPDISSWNFASRYQRTWCLKATLVVLVVWLSGVVLLNFHYLEIRTTSMTAFSSWLGLRQTMKLTNASLHFFGYGLGGGHDTVADGCDFPDLDPFDPAVMAVTNFSASINCDHEQPHLVSLYGTVLKVNLKKTDVYTNTSRKFRNCRYMALARTSGSDLEFRTIHTSPAFNDSITVRDNHDDVMVECVDVNSTVLSRSFFSIVRVKPALETSLKEVYRRHIASSAPKEVLSVLMIGIDGNSRQNLERQMPKTRNYLLRVLKAIDLRRYNTMGGQTYTTVVPMLTGKPAESLDSPHWNYTKHFDAVNYRFLWSDFQKAGYRTAAFFDDKWITAFHYLKKGWNQAPVHYYFRASLLGQMRDTFMRRRGTDCVGDQPEVALNHHFWIRLASTFKNDKTRPYFGFSFSAHLTHDHPARAGAGDHLYLDFLKSLHDQNLLNNTLLVFFSDHGPRYGALRITSNGMIESRTPYMFLVFPAWFYQKYPEVTRVLRANQDRLTTNTDIYQTLQHVLHFRGETDLTDPNQKGGISLFKEIPRGRTCQQADISIDYCVCNQARTAEVSGKTSLVLTVAFLDQLNRIIGPVENKCSKLSIKSLSRILHVKTGNTTFTGLLFYRVTITTSPGDAIFEATLSLSEKTTWVRLVGEINRLNMYRGQAECVDDPKLRPFCYCVKH